MNYVLNLNIIIILALFHFISISGSQVLENPTKIISDKKYPIVFNHNDQFYQIITSGEIYLKEKETRTISSRLSIGEYSSPYFLCKDASSNNFLFANTAFYQITLDLDSKIINFNSQTLTIGDFQYIGYITEENIKIMTYEGDTRTLVDPGTIIIYGAEGTNIHFYYNSDSPFYCSCDVESVFNNKISCKSIERSLYICSIVFGTTINIRLFSYKKKTLVMGGTSPLA